MAGLGKRDMSKNRKKILLVDDESITLELLRYMLTEEFDCECVTFGSAKGALSHLNSAGVDSYDLVISDWEMPSINGIEFLHQLREMSQSLPFLMLTGNATRELVMEAVKEGASDFIAKPFRNIDLIHKVRPLLNPSVQLDQP